MIFSNSISARNLSIKNKAAMIFAALAFIIAPAPVSAQVAISIDFGTAGAGGGFDPNVVNSTETLGVDSVSNWNAIAPTTGVSTALTDSLGTVTTLSLNLTAAASNNIGYSDTSTPSGQMFRTYVDAGGAYTSASTFAFSGLTYSLANIIIYFDGANGSSNRVAAYTITSGAFSSELYGMDAANATAGTGPFVNATSTINSALTTAGNYVEFTNVPITGNSFTILANGDGYASDGISRSPVSGLQIVDADVVIVPEPQTYIMILAGLCALGACRTMRRNRV